MGQSLKTAIFLTGAAARISQEVALLDKLIANKGLRISQDDTLLAGFSSGSLNLIAINGAFSNHPAFDWNTYYKQEVLFKLTNEQVFKAFPSYHKLFPLLDTSPLRNTLNNFLAKMNVQLAGDLAFASYVLAFAHCGHKTRWAYSCNRGNKNLQILDLVMASTAIPFLFPSQRIGSKLFKKRSFPYGKFNDGGTSGTFKRFEKTLDNFISANGTLDNIYIISPMRENGIAEIEAQSNKILEKVSDKIDLNKIKDFLSNIQLNSFLHFLWKLQEWNTNNAKIKNIYVSIPALDKNFFIIDFNVEQEQYNKVCQWIDNHPDRLAVPIQQYLSEHTQ